jgi:hypothetical protein
MLNATEPKQGRKTLLANRSEPNRTEKHFPALGRRALLRAFAFAALLRFVPTRLQATMAMPMDQFLQDHTVEPDSASHRCYRAHAYIHLFALPIFSRQDVGGGYAVVEHGMVGEQAMVGLQFAGGSSGERAHGLNRVGLIQEAVIEQHGSCTEAAYFGFMVSSSEKSLDQGRKSLQTNTQGSIPYTAATGSGRVGRFRCAVSHLAVPAQFNWKNFAELTREMRTLIGTATDTTNFDVSLGSGTAHPDTFLYSVRKAVLSPQPKMSNSIVYNGKRYLLTTEKQADRRFGLQLQARGVTHKADSIWRLNGTTTEAQTRQATTFEIWYEQGDRSGLPVRIEFYPKSFLKLVFEQTTSEDGPKFSYLLCPKASRVESTG